MFLQKLYSEPNGLFKTVEFKDGVNFIFAKKDGNFSKESLNGVGKSTTLELIDFCLCSDYNSSSSTRLYKEIERIRNYYVVLEFEINGTEYVIRRSANNSKKVEIGNDYNIKEYDVKEARKELFYIIFGNNSYQGVLKDYWYRSIMGFFVKIHKKSKNEFIDPILYLTSNNKSVELNQYHLYLMGIDNRLAFKNLELQNSVKDRDAALREIKRLIERNFSISIKDANKKIDRLQSEILKSTTLIESFKLAEQHKNVEEKLNQLTTEIKTLSEENYWDNRKLESYKESIELKDILPASKIKGIQKLYSELVGELGTVIKKSLEDAVEFRKSLSASREEFLKEELNKLNESILKRERIIEVLDFERASLFESLKAKEAIKDLTEAYMYVGKLQGDVSELESRVKTYQDLESDKNRWKIEDAKISIEIDDFLVEAKEHIKTFREIFNSVYENIYPQSSSSGFSITKSLDNKSKSKISINVSFESEESKGWNKGRTLIYDIAIMLNIIKYKIKSPRFLIHDGIFDGMDKAHFVDLYHFVQEQQEKGNRFQYIITLNEEGTLSQAFGNTDDLTPEKIANEAIEVLTPKNKFWRR